MNIGRYALSVVAVFIFVFLFEAFLHGYWLMNLYHETKEVWRPEAEQKFFPMHLSQLAFSAVAAFIFSKHYEGLGIGEGLRFGLYIGLLIGAVKIGTYGYLPIPCILTTSWVVAAVLKGIGTGAILSLVYKN